MPSRARFLRFSRALGVLAVGVLLGAPRGDPAGAAAGGGAPAPHRQELERLLGGAEAVLAGMASLRGVDPPRDLLKAVRPRQAIVARYLELLRERYPPGRLEAERKVLAAFGVIPADFPLERFLAEMAGEQVAAYFDHLRGELVLADWLPAPAQAPVLAHELVHALQARHLDLRQFLAREAGRSDALLARHALLEGEATALMLDLALRAAGQDLGRAPPLPGSLADPAGLAGSPVLSGAPRFLREHLLFPYLAGTAFVAAFRQRHPWPAFSRLYRDPPRSTEQILHPEKYLGVRDDPRLVLLPDVRGLLGPGWSLVLEDDAGEFAIRGILERFLPEAEAHGAAAGWGGDRLQLYERAGDAARALVFLTAWDGEADAREFARAYVRLVAAKFPAARASRGRGSGRRWRAGDAALLVERRGSDVLVLEGVPPEGVEAVRRWVWRLRASRP